jgi:hypothetical protein
MGPSGGDHGNDETFESYIEPAKVQQGRGQERGPRGSQGEARHAAPGQAWARRPGDEPRASDRHRPLGGARERRESPAAAQKTLDIVLAKAVDVDPEAFFVITETVDLVPVAGRGTAKEERGRGRGRIRSIDMPSHDLGPNTLAVTRFLSALAELHPANLAGAIRAAQADPEWAEARRVVGHAIDRDAARRAAANEVARRVRAVVASRLPAHASDAATEDPDAPVVAAALALLVRDYLSDAGSDASFRTLYRPFAGLIPLDTLSVARDDERERLDTT